MIRNSISKAIHPHPPQENAKFLLHMDGGLIEAYDENRTLIAVYQRNENRTCETLSLKNYKPYFTQP